MRWVQANELYAMCVRLCIDDIDSGRDDGKRKEFGLSTIN